MSSRRSKWPQIRIIGEEDDSCGISEVAQSIGVVEPITVPTVVESALCSGTAGVTAASGGGDGEDAGMVGYSVHAAEIDIAFSEVIEPCAEAEGYASLDVDELCIFLDPLDGSREFVNERKGLAQNTRQQL